MSVCKYEAGAGSAAVGETRCPETSRPLADLTAERERSEKTSHASSPKAKRPFGLAPAGGRRPSPKSPPTNQNARVRRPL
ncbi:hypothetical protein EYF80_057942 [Liparis tanakae]|uniref:Uncharacterized protein n=1 Tax=Liparis tanakae TaxID=230148 RepID=A0A4Z2ESV9_9TELE|nr:hypothetical protein EYF80_057942 [Liparis tanakae]